MERRTSKGGWSIERKRGWEGKLTKEKGEYKWRKKNSDKNKGKVGR